MARWELNDEDVFILRQMVSWFKNLRGPGIKNTPHGPSFNLQPTQQRRGGGSQSCSTDSPVTLGSDAELTVADVTALADFEWNRGDGPIDIWHSIGPFYDETDDYKVYDVKYLERKDSCGETYFIGQVTLVEVDATVECP